MNRRVMPTYTIILTLFALTILGMGTLVWLSPVPAGQLTPAQDNLIGIADWMVKTSVGAILGFVGATRLAGISIWGDLTGIPRQTSSDRGPQLVNHPFPSQPFYFPGGQAQKFPEDVGVVLADVTVVPVLHRRFR